MRQAQFILLFFLSTPALYPSEPKYAASDIHVNLLSNAKVVVRNEKIELTIISPEEAIERVQYAITILNENGFEDSKFIQFYDKFSKIGRFSGTVYDGNGNEVKKIRNADIIDFAAISGYSLYEDTRVKFADPSYRNVPFTVEYDYEIKYSGLLYFPNWMPYKDFNISVEQSQFTVVAPISQKLLYHESNLETACLKTEKDDKSVYNWLVKDLPAVKKEPFSLSMEAYLPLVRITPFDFEIDGYVGSFETWNSFGKWIQLLNKGRDSLNEETQKQVTGLIANTSNDVEKTKVLYNYFQDKTRYVSIQVGIGSWQPFKAETVDELSYGDCKALSNYMKALLDVAGVRSYYTLANAGTDAAPIVTDFPSQQFNHVILCVPLNNDTLWLECTNQQIPFGYAGTFTDDRDVLVINDSGGVIAHTKSFSHDFHKQLCTATVTLDNDLNAVSLVHTNYSGMFYDEMFPVLHSDNSDKERYIQEHLHLPNFTLAGFTYSENRTFSPSISEELSLNMQHLASGLNGKYLVPLVLFHRMEDLPLSSNRRSDIYIRRSNTVVDSVRFIIPPEYAVDQIPEDTKIESAYGTYSLEISLENGQVLLTRTLTMNKGTYPATGYNDFIEFLEKIQEFDATNFILERK